jgi:hypothetical protein
MKEISLFIFIIGIIFLTVGYMNNKIKEQSENTKIEYRIIPKSIYDEQIEPSNVLDTFSKMFSEADPSTDSNYMISN